MIGMSKRLQLATDEEGFLSDLALWSPDVALQIAEAENVLLSDEHWEIINLVRQFYEEFEHSPEMRPLVKYVKQNLGLEKGSSLYLLKLFPGSPAKLVCKIAGLPRPTNCL